MSVVATVSVPAGEFTLGATLADDAGIRVRLDRIIPLGDAFVPYLWASDDTVEAIESELHGEADVESFSVVDVADGEALVRVEWDERSDGLLRTVAETGGVVLSGTGARNVWRLRLRFDDHDRLSAFYRRCAERDIPVDVERVRDPDLPRDVGPTSELTDEQREALAVALEEGYFAVPRGITLVALAERLGISDTAASQRLRRGIASALRGAAIEPANREE